MVIIAIVNLVQKKLIHLLKTLILILIYLLIILSDFKSFNDFFIRKLTPEARPINKDKNILISPGDGRLLAYTNIDINSLIQVKGITYSLSELLEDNPIANEYAGGTCLVLRLCPTDYHRLHFIDNGIPRKIKYS